LSLAVGHQLTFARHRREAAFESVALGGAANPKRKRELIDAHRHAALAQHIEYLFAAWNIYITLIASRPARNDRRRTD
jgi:hypothetical protein